METGLRIDNNHPATDEPLKGLFILPRINLLFNITSNLSSRIGGGLGYKMPTPFIEDADKIAYQNVQSIDFSKMKAEKSYGLNGDLNYFFLFSDFNININQFFYYTKLSDPIYLQNTVYVNGNGYIDTRGAETNLKINIDELAIYLGYTYTDTRQHFSGGNQWQPLTARNRINADITYEITNSFRFGVESFYTSNQLLDDGSLGKSFITFGFLVQKMWKHLNIFLNFENLTDQRQTRWGPIYTGPVSNPVFNDIYAPIDGRVINGGLLIKL
jgi:iron complex outermembrane receptor protein